MWSKFRKKVSKPRKCELSSDTSRDDGSDDTNDETPISPVKVVHHSPNGVNKSLAICLTKDGEPCACNSGRALPAEVMRALHEHNNVSGNESDCQEEKPCSPELGKLNKNNQSPKTINYYFSGSDRSRFDKKKASTTPSNTNKKDCKSAQKEKSHRSSSANRNTKRSKNENLDKTPDHGKSTESVKKEKVPVRPVSLPAQKVQSCDSLWQTKPDEKADKDLTAAKTAGLSKGPAVERPKTLKPSIVVPPETGKQSFKNNATQNTDFDKTHLQSLSSSSSKGPSLTSEEGAESGYATQDDVQDNLLRSVSLTAEPVDIPDKVKCRISRESTGEEDVFHNPDSFNDKMNIICELPMPPSDKLVDGGGAMEGLDYRLPFGSTTASFSTFAPPVKMKTEMANVTTNSPPKSNLNIVVAEVHADQGGKPSASAPKSPVGVKANPTNALANPIGGPPPPMMIRKQQVAKAPTSPPPPPGPAPPPLCLGRPPSKDNVLFDRQNNNNDGNGGAGVKADQPQVANPRSGILLDVNQNPQNEIGNDGAGLGDNQAGRGSRGSRQGPAAASAVMTQGRGPGAKNENGPDLPAQNTVAGKGGGRAVGIEGSQPSREAAPTGPSSSLLASVAAAAAAAGAAKASKSASGGDSSGSVKDDNSRGQSARETVDYLRATGTCMTEVHRPASLCTGNGPDGGRVPLAAVYASVPKGSSPIHPDPPADWLSTSPTPATQTKITTTTATTKTPPRPEQQPPGPSPVQTVKHNASPPPALTMNHATCIGDTETLLVRGKVSTVVTEEHEGKKRREGKPPPPERRQSSLEPEPKRDVTSRCGDPATSPACNEGETDTVNVDLVETETEVIAPQSDPEELPPVPSRNYGSFSAKRNTGKKPVSIPGNNTTIPEVKDAESKSSPPGKTTRNQGYEGGSGLSALTQSDLDFFEGQQLEPAENPEEITEEPEPIHMTWEEVMKEAKILGIPLNCPAAGFSTLDCGRRSSLTSSESSTTPTASPKHERGALVKRSQSECKKRSPFKEKFKLQNLFSKKSKGDVRGGGGCGVHVSSATLPTSGERRSGGGSVGGSMGTPSGHRRISGSRTSSDYSGGSPGSPVAMAMPQDIHLPAGASAATLAACMCASPQVSHRMMSVNPYHHYTYHHHSPHHQVNVSVNVSVVSNVTTGGGGGGPYSPSSQGDFSLLGQSRESLGSSSRSLASQHSMSNHSLSQQSSISGHSSHSYHSAHSVASASLTARGSPTRIRSAGQSAGQSAGGLNGSVAAPLNGTTISTSGGGSNADFIASLQKLKDCGWYWGPLGWDDAEAKLSNKADGSFLVRDSSDDHYILSLSFRSQGTTHHTRIEHYKGMFSFYSQPKSHGAATIVEFIEKAMEHSRNGKFLYFLRPRAPGLPPAPVQLLFPVSRFQNMQSLQHMCRFVILKVVRKDHVDRLPIPPRVKEYLKQSQYYTEFLSGSPDAAPDRRMFTL